MVHLGQKLTLGGLMATVIGMAGCVHSQLAIDRTQRAAIAKQSRYLSKYNSTIEMAMERDKTRSAIVLVHDTDQPPDIWTTDTPAETLATKVDSNVLREAWGCVLYFRNDIPVSPQPLSCDLLRNIAQEQAKTSNREKQQDASIDEIEKKLSAIATNLSTLEESTKSIEAALRRDLESLRDNVGKQGEDARSMRGIIGSTTKVVYLQQAELKELRESLKLVLASYKQSIDVVGKNNEQIDKMALDLANSMSALTTQIQTMKQKLDMIK